MNATRTMAQPIEARVKQPNLERGGELPPGLEECALIKLSLEAVSAVAPQLSQWCDPAGRRLNPQMLLTLLTYSYAAGASTSEDIEWACQHDPATRYISGGAEVNQDAVRAFRRTHRPWIEACLARVLERVHSAKPAGFGEEAQRAGTLDAPGDSPYLSLARRRLELAVLMDMAMAD